MSRRASLLIFLPLLAFGTAVCDSEVERTPGGGAGGEAGAPFESEIPPVVAGTRLSPRYLDGGDGARLFYDFYDAQLGTACSFVEASDGAWRCVPAGWACRDGYSSCEQPAFVSALEDDGCGNPIVTGVARAPAGSTPPSPLHEIRWGDCLGVGAPGMSIGWDGATEVSLDLFVRGQLQSIPLQGDLALQQIVADDGTKVTIGFTRAGAPCVPTPFGTELRCLDRIVGYMSFSMFEEQHALYAEPGCTGDRAARFGFSTEFAACTVKPLLSSDGVPPQYSLPPYFGSYEPEVCPGDARYYQALEEVFGVSSSLGGQCFPYEEPDRRFARVGTEVPASALPRLEQIQVGTGRLRALWIAGGGSAVGSMKTNWGVKAREFFDTQLGTRCTATVTADGQVRCIPSDTETAFADETCSQIAMADERWRCDKEANSRFSSVRSAIVACPNGSGSYDHNPPSQVLERGETLVDTVYGTAPNVPNNCASFDGGDKAWYLPGTVHPLTDFAVISFGTES